MNIDIQHIYQLITKYEEIVPLPIDWLLCAIAFGIVIILFAKRKSYQGFTVNAAWVLLAIYILMIIFGTVIFREAKPEMRYHLIPLIRYTAIYDGFVADVLVNVGMLIPVGFLGAITFGHKNVLKVAAIGCLLSTIIELAQLLGRCGVCNIDDVIHNTIGCVIGYGIFILCDKLFHQIFGMQIADAHTMFAK